MSRRAVLGLSGGVDSAVAAALLREQGYEVFGLYLHAKQFAPGGVEAAQKVAREAEIPLEIWDISSDLEQQVICPFVSAYLRGETPSPCVFCNPRVKFAALAAYADRVGAPHIATGHYARLTRAENGKRMLQAAASQKDQSYMLYGLSQAVIDRLIFPLGELEKSAVREKAAELGLTVADAPDSMEICFIPQGDHGAFIREKAGREACDATAGMFIDGEGKPIAPHRGLYHYTVGQRKGLGIALGKPVFVAEIDPGKNTVTLLPAGGEVRQEIALRDCVWHISGEPGQQISCKVRVRHSRTFTVGIVTILGENRAKIQFPDGVRAPAPGQAAVCYGQGDGWEDLVLGGGIICRPGEGTE